MAAGNGSVSYTGKKVRARVAVGAPTSETGRVNVPGVLPWAQFGWIDQTEHVPDLIWPNSVRTYNEMRTDSQVSGLHLGITLPIRRYKWMIAPNDAKPEIVANVAQDLRLPVQGEEKKFVPARRRGFSWDDFLRHALLATAYGFYYFELTGEIRGGLWRMDDISPRPPSTISQVTVSDQGDLVNFKQAVGINQPEIDATRAVPFVWDREAGNWFGRSLFRPMYKHWIRKDRLLRVDAMKHDRNGLGVPIAEAPPGATPQQIEDLDYLAQRFRAGDYAGGAIPSGAKLTLQGTQGSLPDTLASINYDDEAMARSLLMMFIQLGMTKSGSRALGEQFIDYFALAQETIALWCEDTVNQWVIERWVDFNYGEDEVAPSLVHERDPDPDLSVQDLALLIEKGAVRVDPEIEGYIRDRYLLPPAPDSASVPTQAPTPPAATPPVAARRRSTVVAQGSVSLLPLPSRSLRRQPYEQEVRAQVDYAAMENDYVAARTALVAAVKQGQTSQIESLHEAIVAAKNNLEKLAKIQAPPVHATEIQSRMVQLASAGASQAISEAAKQGAGISMPDLASVNGRLSSRATAVDSVLSRSLSEAGARKALSLAGTAKTPQQVADATSEYLHGLSTKYLEDQLGGALQQAMNAGRKEVISSGPESDVYASELLDSNTCELCVDVDGTQYADIDAAEADYPTGGYMDCLGGPRCRGTIIAVYSEAPEAA